MSGHVQFLVLTLSSLVAIINPVSAAPLYVALTAEFDPRHRAATLWRAIATGFVVLVAFAALGSWILRFFGITTYAFQIAGGIVVFAIGWDMLQARRSRVKTTVEEEAESAGREDVGIIPLGLPTLVGPGAITAVITIIGQSHGVLEEVLVYAAIALSMVASWLILLVSPMLLRRLGRTGLNIFNRLMGLLVMVIGAQFVVDGVQTVVLHIAHRI